MFQQARRAAGFSTAVFGFAVLAGCASDHARQAAPTDAGTGEVPPDETGGQGLFTNCVDGRPVVFGSSMESGGVSPDIPDTVVRSVAPPPALSGGTLLALADGKTLPSAIRNGTGYLRRRPDRRHRAHRRAATGRRARAAGGGRVVSGSRRASSRRCDRRHRSCDRHLDEPPRRLQRPTRHRLPTGQRPSACGVRGRRAGVVAGGRRAGHPNAEARARPS